jgi:hypothetical protein
VDSRSQLSGLVMAAAIGRIRDTIIMQGRNDLPLWASPKPSAPPWAMFGRDILTPDANSSPEFGLDV